GQPRAARDLVMATVTTALDEEDQIALNRLAGVAFAALGEHDDAEDYLSGMINRARVRQMVPEFAEAVADLLVWLPMIPDRTRLELIEEALRALPQLHERSAVRLLSAAANTLVHVDHDRAMALWAQADALDWRSFERSAATDVLALPVLHGCQADQDAIAEAVHELDGLDQRFGHGAALAAVGRLSLALIRGTRDQITRALMHLDAALRRWPSPELAAYGAAARMALARFDADHLQLAALTEDPTWLQAPPQSHAGVLLGVGHLLWQQALGELPPLSDEAARACQVNAPRSRLDMELTALGINAMANPDLEGELRRRLDAMATDCDAVPRDHRWAGELAAMAAFAGVVGDVILATRAADLLQPHLEEMAVVLPTGVSGPVGLHVAHARIAAGDTVAAMVATDAALRCCERVGAPSWEALTRLVQARIALLEQRPEEARAALETITRLTGQGSMPRVQADAQRLEAQLDALGCTGAGSPYMLSERELEVLGLVSAGATNRQVARTLSISEKTVEYHLAGAFRTLGAANRTEAVELARRAALL
ncbi:MAG TPA: LuxR C-terminal-related transcriptional regulator, partial [Euzebya sp.]|nr:LuxR C-terminal-related transcriptional regulator [Euzebya sp.]